MKANKILTGFMVVSIGFLLTACGHPAKQKADGAHKPNTEQLQQTLTSKQTQKLVNEALNNSTTSAVIDLKSVTKIKKGKTQKEHNITKYSSDSNVIYRKLGTGETKSKGSLLWGNSKTMYAKVNGKWYKASSNNAVKGIKSSKKMLTDTIKTFSNKKMLPYVTAKREHGVGINGLVRMSYDVSTHAKGNLQDAPTHNRVTMIVNENTKQVTDIQLEKITNYNNGTDVTIKAHFSQINELNDLNVPKKVRKNAIKASLN